MNPAPAARTDWSLVLEPGDEPWVEAQDGTVTLRQCFYFAVSAQLIPNTTSAYKRLSDLTAKARRAGEFPAFIDGTRDILTAPTWTSPDDFARSVVPQYRVDRWAGQDSLVILGVEKRGMGTQVQRWFGQLGCPIVPLGGFASQTLADDVASLIVADGRHAVLLYVGDHDASGHDIERDFVDRVGAFSHVDRVALTPDQVEEFGLPENPAKESDSRTAGFSAVYGPVQVEVDALPPDVLRSLIGDAISDRMDVSAFDAARGREDAERAELAERFGVAS